MQQRYIIAAAVLVVLVLVYWTYARERMNNYVHPVSSIHETVHDYSRLDDVLDGPLEKRRKELKGTYTERTGLGTMSGYETWGGGLSLWRPGAAVFGWRPEKPGKKPPPRVGEDLGPLGIRPLPDDGIPENWDLPWTPMVDRYSHEAQGVLPAHDQHGSYRVTMEPDHRQLIGATSYD